MHYNKCQNEEKFYRLQNALKRRFLITYIQHICTNYMLHSSTRCNPCAKTVSSHLSFKLIGSSFMYPSCLLLFLALFPSFPSSFFFSSFFIFFPIEFSNIFNQTTTVSFFLKKASIMAFQWWQQQQLCFHIVLYCFIIFSVLCKVN